MAHEESGPSDVKSLFALFAQQNEIAKQQNEIVKQVITGQQDRPALPHPIDLPLDRCLTTDEAGNAQRPPLHAASHAAGYGAGFANLAESFGSRQKVDSHSKPIPLPRASKRSNQQPGQAAGGVPAGGTRPVSRCNSPIPKPRAQPKAPLQRNGAVPELSAHAGSYGEGQNLQRQVRARSISNASTNSSPGDSAALEEFSITGWCKHLNERTQNNIPGVNDKDMLKKLSEMTKDINAPDITHLWVHGGIPPLSHTAPDVRWLRITGLSDATALESCSLQLLSKLEELEIESCDFSKGLPVSVYQITSLKTLRLRCCDLTSLPTQLNQLGELKVLDLYDNEFEEGFPSVLSSLESVEQLHLSYCPSSKWPETLNLLKNMKKLQLWHSDFSQGFPTAILLLASLTELQLSGCTLSYLPATFSKLKLKVLEMNGADFHDGLPDVVCELKLLKELHVVNCSLSTLPPRFGELQELNALSLAFNEFEELPSTLYMLKNIQALDVRHNLRLKKLDKELLHLGKLADLQCDGCKLLRDPPYHIAQSGLLAVRMNWAVPKTPELGDVYEVPMAVIGAPLSGKTSLVRSLMTRKRSLTFRCEVGFSNPPYEPLCVRLDQHGLCVCLFDNDCWRMVCKPELVVIVINLKQFCDLAEAEGATVAWRCLQFDWVPHIYQDFPGLPSPMLVLTHADQLDTSQVQHCREQLVKCAEDFWRRFLVASRISRSTNLSVFTLTNDLSDYSCVISLQSTIQQRCENIPLSPPTSTELVRRFFALKEGTYIPLLEMKRALVVEDLEDTLRYEHNAGRIWWFEDNDELSPYVFYNRSAISDVIMRFCHLEDWWKQHLSQSGESAKHQRLLQDGSKTGLLHEDLLNGLITDVGIPLPLFVGLMQCLHVLYGPLKEFRAKIYIAPSFRPEDMGDDWKTDGELQLRVEMVPSGLPLNTHMFNQAVLSVLNCSTITGQATYVRRNGVTIRLANYSIHLERDRILNKLHLQVSTTPDYVGASWKTLMERSAIVFEVLRRQQHSGHTQISVVCAHCLFVGNPTPSLSVDPDWLLHQQAIDIRHVRTFAGTELVVCEQNGPLPSIPSALVYPCFKLTKPQKRMLKEYLEKCNSEPERLPDRTIDETWQFHQLLTQSTVEDSDLSDDMDCLDQTNEQLDLIGAHVELIHVTKPDVMNLFNSDRVYYMSSPIRGRCLIINNRQFQDPLSNRPGSETDVQNIRDVFLQLSFECPMVHNDLSGQDMLRVIEEETQHVAHNDYGMFVLVIMSHGEETQLRGTDGSRINLSHVYDLMSPQRFAAMAGKPKWLIIQSCSGGRRDMMGTDAGAHISVDVRPTTQATVQPSTSAAPQHEPANPPVEQNLRLASDDLFIMRASFPSYVSVRHSRSGTWFVRALVEALYKHSCHRDIQTLFEKQVMRKVRMKSIAYHRQHGVIGGQQPVMICTPTDGRKLYLFPGHNPASRQLP